MNREERPSRMVLTVTEDTPADMLTGSMELLVQLPRNHHLHTQKVTVLRSTPMMDLLVQIATAHKLTASNYNLQAIGERDLILPHHPNTPIGALDALQVKLLPKQGTCVALKSKQVNQPFETTFRLQVHLPRNQLYVSRVSPKTNLGEILDKVCREKNLDRSKYELRHPVNLEETLQLSLSLQDYHLQEVTLYAKQTRSLGPTPSTQDIMALQRREERRRQQTKQSVFGFMFKKSKENSPSMDSLGVRSVSPARSDETARSVSPLQPAPARPQRKRRLAPKPPANAAQTVQNISGDSGKDKMTIINHSRNSSDSSGYHEASVLSDNPDSAARLPETLPRTSKAPSLFDASRKLAQTLQSSKSLGNLTATDETLSRGISSTFLSSTVSRVYHVEVAVRF
ncbi:cordon-bleu protein-like 1 isoform X2 [Temnothorax curvispinosus]|uniref:Cordon-bleu protein-like 1 isoform X2 n=1 Tax=Temnothorax curvispinosus TaxID=300111 RepID=A0A6J1RH36_9HYME|nr:cordon-bleu protein-like 1 isoform X2 [Temnothorax curvispinosus]